MSTRATIAFVDDCAIHIFSDSFDEDPERIHVEIQGPFTADGGRGFQRTTTATTRTRFAEACEQFLKRHAEYLAWKSGHK